MDIVNHAAYGGLMGYWLSLRFNLNKYVWVSLGLFLGAFNDILGWIEKIVTGNPNAWNWYNWIHKDAWYLWIFPPVGFHTLIDYPSHGLLFYWYEGWGWLYFVFNWVVVLSIAIYFYSLKKREGT
jgi:hypothetical protein